VSIISRLRAVVAGDDYLDSEYDDLDYETDDQMDMDHNSDHARGGALAPPSESSPFDLGGGFSSSNVIGMPGIASASAEVNLMEPRSFDEMPRAIQALRERKTVILNLTMMEPDQAQRAVDFVAGGTFAIDGHQERVGESIFLFAPSCVTVSNASHDESSAPTVVSQDLDSAAVSSSSQVVGSAPVPAWEATRAAGI
jgi:cell division inhibitor SepF|tara:strand:- start:1932 stop:2522 length:591 start_codon:yes stop_codon:yes gene_type:complete